MLRHEALSGKELHSYLSGLGTGAFVFCCFLQCASILRPCLLIILTALPRKGCRTCLTNHIRSISQIASEVDAHTLKETTFAKVMITPITSS